jgi:hypothetical protein
MGDNRKWEAHAATPAHDHAQQRARGRTRFQRVVCYWRTPVIGNRLHGMNSRFNAADLQAMLDEMEREAPFSSLDALNARLVQRMQQYNTTPQPELGGLSPDQTAQLLYGDWATAGAFRVSGEAAPAALLAVPIVADARLLMTYLDANGPVKLTPKGNLTRAAVAELAPQLRTEALNEEAFDLAPLPVRNEDDVRWLPVLKHVLLFGKLATKRKGLLLSARGRTLLPEPQVGALFVELFRTFFRQFDLQYLYSGTPHLGLQQTLPYTFYQLGRTAHDWTPLVPLAEAAWLLSARDPFASWERDHPEARFNAFRYRVLEPLVHFGLLERRLLPAEALYLRRAEFRRTSLYAQLLRFAFTAP